ncbi:MAG TPA: cupin domain-containing protein [Solirubrobacterales bacterium]|nr:cupin domain-containing protein [Solirubrobacterales bacterium]
MSAGYTHLNLKRDVEDMAPKGGMAPDVEARFATASLDLEKSAVSHQRLAPNARAPFGHRHKQQEELYVVLSGSGRIKLDDEIVELRARDAVRIAPDTMRAVEAGPEGIEILAFGAPNLGPASEDIAESVPGWWSEGGP